MKILKEAVNTMANVMSAPARAVNAIKANKGKRELTRKMLSKAKISPGAVNEYGTIGDEDYGYAFNTTKKQLNLGNMVAARKGLTRLKEITRKSER
jgi:hypothetical protein